jgi:hypothetical protein
MQQYSATSYHKYAELVFDRHNRVSRKVAYSISWNALVRQNKLSSGCAPLTALTTQELTF